MSLTAALLGATRYPGAMVKSATDTLASQTIANASTTLICIANVPPVTETPTIPTAQDSASRVYSQAATVNSAAGNARSTIHQVYSATGATMDLTIKEPATGSTNGSGMVKWGAIQITGSSSSPVADYATFAVADGTFTVPVNTTSGGANKPSPENSITPLLFIASRVYGGTIVMDAPSGWTKIADKLTQDGTTSLHIAIYTKNSTLALGDTINQNFTIGSYSSPANNTYSAGASAILLFLRGANLRLRVEFSDWISGSNPIGATSTVGYVTKAGFEAAAATKYTGFSIVSNGSGGARVDLDVTGVQGFVSGDTGYLIITDAIEAASPYNHGTSGGLLSGTVAEGSGDPHV